VLVRSWNLFHGNTVPPGRRAYLREMVELVTADRPDIVCLQEVPGWALGRLGGWAGMTELTVWTKRPTLGPLPIPATLGRALTAPHHGIIRSAFAGQGNAILLAPGLGVRMHETRAFRYGHGHEPRAAQRAELEHLVVANVHCSHDRLGIDELATVMEWLGDAEPLIVAGDFNTTPEHSATIASFTGAILGSIDQVLVRGEAGTSRVWAPEEREFDRRLLSDHAPVELAVSSK
jgi:endonuclease/exonuclease/phosphatase family metal-dependent hydrolase